MDGSHIGSNNDINAHDTILDSGSSNHSTGLRRILKNIEKRDPITMKTVIGMKKVSEIGTLELNKKVKLNNVRFVEGSPFTLMALAPLVDRGNKAVIFFKDRAIALPSELMEQLVEKHEKHTLLSFKRKGNLWVLPLKGVPKPESGIKITKKPVNIGSKPTADHNSIRSEIHRRPDSDSEMHLRPDSEMHLRTTLNDDSLTEMNNPIKKQKGRSNQLKDSTIINAISETAITVTNEKNETPKSYREARIHEDNMKRGATEKGKINSIIKNEVWTEHRLSKDKKAIESHSVYDVKRNKNDNINYRHRARIKEDDSMTCNEIK
jgi:hypothetical protein